MSSLFTRFLACSIGMGLFSTLLIISAPQWSRFFAAKWSVRLWAILAVCLCLPLAPGVPAVEAFFTKYPWIISIWLIIALFIIGFTFYRQIGFRRDSLKWSTIPKKISYQTKATELAKELHMEKCPQIHITAKVSCPTILGLGDPLLLLPHEEYTDAEFDIILRHEFYHYLHGHINYKVFLFIINSLHWFNPAIWFMREKASIDLEAACDDALLMNASDKTRRQYSDTVLSVMQSPATCPTPFSTHTYGNPTATGHRLVRLLAAPPKNGGIALLFMAVFFSFLSGTAVATATANLEVVAPTVSTPPPIVASSSSLSSSSSIPESKPESIPEPEPEPEPKPEPVPEFPIDTLAKLNKALPETFRIITNDIKGNFPVLVPDLTKIIIPGEKASGMPTDDVFMAVINKVIDAYNNDTADTSLSDPDAPRLMPCPDSVGIIPPIISPEAFKALPRTANGYSALIPIEGKNIDMQIWMDDNGPDNEYEFAIVAVSFVRS